MHDRRRYLGSSDISGILGISPWATPLSVYEKKISNENEPIDEKNKRLFDRGHRWEEVALEMLMTTLEEKHDARPELIRRNCRYFDAAHDFMCAEIDAEIIFQGERANVEIKTVHPFAASHWGEQGSEEIPIHYAAQCLWGQGITGRERTIVGALFGADTMLNFTVEHDAETLKTMREKAIEFWHKNVLERVPPEPSNMMEIYKIFAKRVGTPVNLTTEMANLVLRIRDLRREQKDAKLIEEDCAFRLGQYIINQWTITGMPTKGIDDDASLIWNGFPMATWKGQSQKRIDVERLRNDLPDIAAKYEKENSFRVLRIKK